MPTVLIAKLLLVCLKLRRRGYNIGSNIKLEHGHIPKNVENPSFKPMLKNFFSNGSKLMLWSNNVIIIYQKYITENIQ